jgi:ABC-type multidrug transport system fused ATPase/permease subunit
VSEDDGGLPVASAATVRGWARSSARRHRPGLAAVLGLQGAASAAGLLFPHELGLMVAAVAGPHGAGAVRTAAIVLAVSLVVQAVVARLASRWAAVLGETVLAELREDFVDRVLDLPLGLVERAGTGELLTRATSDVESLSYAIRYAIPQLLIAAVQALLTAAALVVTAPVLGVVLIPAIVVVGVGLRWYLARAPAGYRTTQATWDRLNGRMQETAASGRTVHALRLGPRRVALGEDDVRRWLDAERYTLGLRSRFFPVCEAAYVLPLVLAVLVGGLLSIGGHLSIAAVTAAALYAQQLVVPVDTVISQLDTMQLATASLARLLGVSEVDRRAPTDELPVDSVVDMAAVRFAYRPDREVLGGLDLSPTPGSTVALVGPSGAGKSTIALLIAGIHAPTAGRVTVGGVDTYRLPSDRLRREVVLVTQEHHVFSGTLRDNLVLAAPGTSDARLAAALEATDSAALLRRLPLGLDAPLGAGGAALSPGEAQRLALARLVLADPHTLVLDEATALLDPVAARHLERSLHRVLAGRTVIAVAHRLQTARDADLVAVIDKGRVVESGTHDELLAAGGAYARLWASWRRQDPGEPPPVASGT